MSPDLNLLVSMDALLQERSVTRAAQRLGLSQPSLSAALARLRRHFDDELLTRVGNSYELTALGERLAEQTSLALSWTDRVFQTRADFDPEHSEHEFTLVVADCHLPVFGRVLADLIQRQAPHVRLTFQHSTAQFVHRASDQLRAVDAIVLPQGVLVNMPTLQLYRDRWVCVISSDSAGRPLDREQLSGRPWVFAYQHPFSALSTMPRLAEEGVRIRSSITTEDFLAVPHLVRGTDRIGLMPERVARLHPAGEGVTIADLPFELGDLLESLWWHPAHERDPAHTWLRHMASQAGRIVERS
ncbi:LysR family transcriptional regulator [Streptomyces poonensis]|uniref:LysR family transcriptional regulator n=1 Tax=Streptomyces poonensis TaxID=68255 RepID=A0A918QGW4_9ACTN|nr:LysR family transcriptional regulator [Streptomyces poonensis]GGZ43675.1 LysR family transcriptional regulator [Streptomyces poonensis]GLJ91683.1 LysR family transcriptional regulator [Streptomyces poonensis]